MTFRTVKRVFTSSEGTLTNIETEGEYFLLSGPPRKFTTSTNLLCNSGVHRRRLLLTGLLLLEEGKLLLVEGPLFLIEAIVFCCTI